MHSPGHTAELFPTVIGTLSHTSTVTIFRDVNAGGRTGLTSVFCGIFFFIAMFLSPIAQLTPIRPTAAAQIYVGILSTVSVKSLNRDDLKIAIPVFVTMCVFLSPITSPTALPSV